MSRLSTYLTSQKLAKQWLVTAEERLKRGEKDGAIAALIASVREFQTSSNCLASLAWQKKGKV